MSDEKLCGRTEVKKSEGENPEGEITIEMGTDLFLQIYGAVV